MENDYIAQLKALLVLYLKKKSKDEIAFHNFTIHLIISFFLESLSLQVKESLDLIIICTPE